MIIDLRVKKSVKDDISSRRTCIANLLWVRCLPFPKHNSPRPGPLNCQRRSRTAGATPNTAACGKGKPSRRFRTSTSKFVSHFERLRATCCFDKCFTRVLNRLGIPTLKKNSSVEICPPWQTLGVLNVLILLKGQICPFRKCLQSERSESWGFVRILQAKNMPFTSSCSVRLAIEIL